MLQKFWVRLRLGRARKGSVWVYLFSLVNVDGFAVLVVVVLLLALSLSFFFPFSFLVNLKVF